MRGSWSSWSSGRIGSWRMELPRVAAMSWTIPLQSRDFGAQPGWNWRFWPRQQQREDWTKRGSFCFRPGIVERCLGEWPQSKVGKRFCDICDTWPTFPANSSRAWSILVMDFCTRSFQTSTGYVLLLSSVQNCSLTKLLGVRCVPFGKAVQKRGHSHSRAGAYFAENSSATKQFHLPPWQAKWSIYRGTGMLGDSQIAHGFRDVTSRQALLELCSGWKERRTNSHLSQAV